MPLKRLRELNHRTNEGIKQKIRQAKEDPRHLALVIVEVLLITLLIIAILFLFDPNLSFAEAEKIPFEIKGALFIATVIIIVKLYSYTTVFRKKKKSLSL